MMPSDRASHALDGTTVHRALTPWVRAALSAIGDRKTSRLG
jgi:hypothetical protein